MAVYCLLKIKFLGWLICMKLAFDDVHLCVINVKKCSVQFIIIT